MKKMLQIRANASGGIDRNFITFAAADGQGSDLANVSGVAYSGAAISQYWSSLKLIIDLAGMEIAQQIPLLYNHYNEPEYRLGEVTAVIDGGKTLQISGGIDKNTERGRFICDAGKQFNWQLSIGAALDPDQIEEVKPDEERTINAQAVKGPFLLVKKSFLREVSVCAVGADPNTVLQIAASLNLNFSKKDNKPTTHNQEGEITMNEKLKKYLQMKFNLGEADENTIKAHLAKIGTTVEAEEAAMNAQAAQPKPQATAEPAAPTAQAAQPALTAEQVAAIVAQQLEAKRQADQKYQADVRAAAEGYADIAEKAIAAHWPVEQVKAVCDAIKAKAPQGTGLNIIMRSGPTVNANSIAAALCFQTGIAEKTITASFGEQEVDSGDKMRGITLQKVLELCCQMENKAIPVMFGNNTIQAAFSTVALPGILSNVANKKALQAFTAQPIIATRLCKDGDLNDFKVSERYRLTDVGDLEKVSKSGEIPHGSVGEDKATNKLETYGKVFVLTRQDIYNDDLGAFLQIPAAMGQRAARKIDQLFHERLLANHTMADGKALFCADHGNYMTGSNTALSKTALEAARAKFLAAVDSDNQPINVAPKFLFVPSVLDSTAETLVISPALVGGSDTVPALNVISRYNLIPISSPYLQSAAYTNNSTTGWYLFGDPAQVDTFEIGYLQGRKVPVVEQGQIDFNNLGMGFRVVYDLGVREQAHQGMVFCKGVA